MPHNPYTPVSFQYSTLAQPQSYPGASSSFNLDCDRSYIDCIHQHPIRESLGTQMAPLVWFFVRSNRIFTFIWPGLLWHLKGYVFLYTWVGTAFWSMSWSWRWWADSSGRERWWAGDAKGEVQGRMFREMMKMRWMRRRRQLRRGRLYLYHQGVQRKEVGLLSMQKRAVKFVSQRRSTTGGKSLQILENRPAESVSTEVLTIERRGWRSPR